MKEIWRPGNMLYPLPAVLVTTRDQDGNDNVCTVAWAGTVCSDPAMVSISLRKSRLTYDNLIKSGEFVINLTTESLVHATDFCGVRSGRDIDKFREEHLNKEESQKISCACIAQSPVNIECRVIRSDDLGSHTMFISEVLAVHADKKYMDKKGRFDLSLAKPIVYSHGEYFSLGRPLGRFGFSVKRHNQTG